MKIDKSSYMAHGRCRFGVANPERIHNQVWEYMVRTRSDPFVVRRDVFGCGDEIERWIEGGGMEGPAWCFLRFGARRVPLPDGRSLWIAGEHEDHYAPDFCIYNDVVLCTPDAPGVEIGLHSGQVEIYGYPESLFPPTDFHSATLVGDVVYVIGRLGYQGTRQPGVTPVMKLNTHTLGFEPVATRGDAPGWIFEHHASYEPRSHAIVVRAGKIVGPDQNIHAWRSVYRLHLEDLRWERVREHEGSREFMIEPADGRADDITEAVLIQLKPRGVPHLWFNAEDRGYEHSEECAPSAALDVLGIRVELDTRSDSLGVLVDGDLQPSVLDELLDDWTQRLETISGRSYRVTERPAKVDGHCT